MSSSNPESEYQEIARLLKKIGGKAGPGENVDTLIGRAARATGMPYSKARAYWYEEAAVVHSKHMDAARAAGGVAAVDQALLAAEMMANVANDMIARLPCASISAVIPTMSAPRMVA